MNILPYLAQDQIILMYDSLLLSFRNEQLNDVHYYYQVNDKLVMLTIDLREREIKRILFN